MTKINPSEITPEHLYLSRRRFMKGVGALAASSLLLAACGSKSPTPTTKPSVGPSPEAGPGGSALPPLSANTDELGARLTSFEAITNYNNFYEFTTSKERVASLTEHSHPAPPS